MDGLKQIWETISDHRKKLSAAGQLEDKRRRQATDWMRNLVEEGLKDQFYSNLHVKQRLAQITKAVESGTTSPTAAAHELLALYNQ
jgi:LAO/AO transport system kinase